VGVKLISDIFYWVSIGFLLDYYCLNQELRIYAKYFYGIWSDYRIFRIMDIESRSRWKDWF